jgi:hypothetical protein
MIKRKHLFNKIVELYNIGFRQSSDATCGPASIILASHGLEFDLKSEAEWLDNCLAKWMPVDQFPIRGMALHELQFVSEFIYRQTIEVKLRRAYPENFSLFQQDIKDSFLTMNTVIVANFCQDDFISKTVCASGNPHYSPIIGWDENTHKLMIADVDPSVQEPYWVAIEDIFQSMSHCNPAFGIPRGWLVLNKRHRIL